MGRANEPVKSEAFVFCARDKWLVEYRFSYPQGAADAGDEIAKFMSNLKWTYGTEFFRRHQFMNAQIRQLRFPLSRAQTDAMISLTGQLLISMPQMEDPFFARSVVYLLAHSEETGAMGLMVNKIADGLTINELYAHSTSRR